MKYLAAIFGLALLVVGARGAHAQYMDGLPVASAVNPADILMICQGGTAGIPGSCTTRQTTLSQALGGGGGGPFLPLSGGTLTGALAGTSGAFSGSLSAGSVSTPGAFSSGNAAVNGLVVGTPSGGSFGTGTVNATALYINGVAVSAGGSPGCTTNCNFGGTTTLSGPLVAQGGSFAGSVGLTAGASLGNGINLSLSTDGLGLFGYNATTGFVQLQNKGLAPLHGIYLPDNQPIVMSSDTTAQFVADTTVHAFRLENWPLEVDAGITIPGGGQFSAGTITAANGVVVGNPTGGNLGNGTINVDTAVYVNGVPLGTGTGTGTVNSGAAGQLAFYAANGTAVSGVSNFPSGVLVTDSSSNPSVSNTLPSGLTIPAPTFTGLVNMGSASLSGSLNVGGTATATSLVVGSTASAGGFLAPFFQAQTGTITYSGSQGSALNQYSVLSNSVINGSLTSSGVNANAFVVSDDNVNLTGASAANAVTWLNVYGNVGQSIWQPNTPYAFGQKRNNGGQLYIVTVAGTSAASGGPTGNGTGIADGSVVWNYVSPDFSGSRAAIQGQLAIISPNDPATPNDSYRQWQSALWTTVITANQGGTALSGGATAGFVYGSGDQAFAKSGATYLSGVVGHESDVAINTGASSIQRSGYTAVSFGNVNGSYYDDAYSISAVGGSPSWVQGIAVTGGSPYPIASTGCVLCYVPPVPGNLAGSGATYANPSSAEVLDLAGFEASTAIWRANGGTNLANNGSMSIQSLSVSTNGANVLLDPTGNQLANVTIGSGGVGFKVGDHVYDPITGTILNIATVNGSGTITAFSSIGSSGSVAGSYFGSAPSNPVSLLGGTGSGATVNMSWTAASLLALSPSGGTVGVANVGNLGAASGNFYIHAVSNKQLQLGNTSAGNGLLLSDPGGTTADYFNFTPGLASSNTVTLSLNGSDTNVGLTVVPKGTGPITLGTSTSTPTVTGGALTVNGDAHFQTTGVHLYFGTIASGANQLPACNSTTNGSVTIIIDWNTQPAFGDNISTQGGGGSIRSLGLCDGTAWHAV